MNPQPLPSPGRAPARSRATLALAGAAVTVLAATWATHLSPASAADADTPVFLGTAAPFAVLAGAGITNTGTTTITGDIGSFPTTDQTIPGVTLNGTNHAGDGVTQQAKNDLVTAYDEAAAAQPPTAVETELGGKTLVGGVYRAPTELGLTGTLTLDGGRSDGLASNKVFVFQAGTTLITEVDSQVVLTGGAQACNVFWQVGSAATFKTRTAFVGTVMAYTEAITAQQGATFDGRLLARDSAVTLDGNTITRPVCAADDGGDTDGGDTDGGDTDGGDTDGGDTDGGDTDGGDTDGGDTDGGDTDGGDTDGGDTDGSGGSSGIDGGVVDGPSTDRGDGTIGRGDAPSDDLPDTGGVNAWVVVGGGAGLLAGATLVRRFGRRDAPLR